MKSFPPDITVVETYLASGVLTVRCARNRIFIFHQMKASLSTALDKEVKYIFEETGRASAAAVDV